MVDYTKIHKYRVKAVCLSPLHIGGSESGKGEVLIHPISGKPFIQSSSIAGMMRSISEHIKNNDTASLFGEARNQDRNEMQETGSRIRISDGQFDLTTVEMELRPRVSIDPESGTVQTKEKVGSNISAGQKFDTEYIAERAVFSYNVYLFEGEKELNDQLKQIFSEIQSESIQIGALKTNGNGFLKIQSLSYHKFDMTNAEERKFWADEDGNQVKYEDILNKITAAEDSRFSYKICVEGKTDGPLLVKDIAVTEFGSEEPDAMNIRNAAKEYIIPGSSLKGALRNRMDYIADFKKKKDLINDIFGRTGKGKDTGFSGHLTVRDVVVGEKEHNDDEVPLQHRVHIDKFTGGVMHGQLFSEKNVSGNVCFEIMLSKFNSADAAAGLLILALRDLAVGMFNIGSGYSIGKGYIDVQHINIIHDGNTAEIDFQQNSINDSEKIISNALNALDQFGRRETDE